MLTCPMSRCCHAFGEHAVQVGRILATEPGRSRPPRIRSDEPLGSDPRSVYDVDFDDFFVLHLLDEVVACGEDPSAVLREGIERV